MPTGRRTRRFGAVARTANSSLVISSKRLTYDTQRKEHPLRILAAILTALALALAPAALADAPDVVTHTNIDRTSTIGACGFPVTVHSEGVFTVWQYLDDAGNVVRERWHVERSFTVTWTNPANGKSIESVLGGPVVTEYLPDGWIRQTVSGRERLFNAPGEGIVAKQVGRIVFLIAPDGTESVPFVAGKWDLDITPELCAYLA